LVLSKRITSEIQLRDYFFRNKFEAVIVGSDQVWRPMYSPSILNFYLDFLNDIDSKPIRVAYAASFGVSEWEYPEDVTEKCRPLIKKFDAVSVREKSAVDLCKSKLGITSDWVVDPTLLLDPSDYEELIDQEAENPQKSLVLSYILDVSKDKQQIATAVAEILQTDVFHIKPGKSISEVRSNDLGQCIYPKVETWLRSFRDAKFVVTDSFHGTVFAILFNRPFVAVGNSKRGMARFESLLSMFGLEHRLVELEDDITSDLINEVIDWDKVNGLRERFACESKLFLKNHLFSEKVNG
jgi:polysaccharide pyruvyl transferase WcaK-like protein